MQNHNTFQISMINLFIYFWSWMKIGNTSATGVAWESWHWWNGNVRRRRGGKCTVWQTIPNKHKGEENKFEIHGEKEASLKILIEFRTNGNWNEIKKTEAIENEAIPFQWMEWKHLFTALNYILF